VAHGPFGQKQRDEVTFTEYGEFVTDPMERVHYDYLSGFEHLGSHGTTVASVFEWIGSPRYDDKRYEGKVKAEIF
jgi:hypothetical protein